MKYLNRLILTVFSSVILLLCSSNGREGSLCSGVLTLDLPVRYLHIQLTRNGHNVTSSVGKLSTAVFGNCSFK